MYATLLLGAFLATSAPAAKPTKPIGPPPKIVLISPPQNGQIHLLVTEPRTTQQVFERSANENGVAVLKRETRDVTTIETKSVALADVGATFRTAGDKALTAGEVAERLKLGGQLIVPAERDPIDAAYTLILSPDAIVVEYAKDGKRTISAAVHNPTQPAPRFVAVKADEKGVLRIPALGKREVTVKIPGNPVDGTGVGAPDSKPVLIETKQSVEDLVPTLFDDVKPTVTTASGQPVAIDDAKKRLAAGTIVIVSENGKPVGEPFLKLVKPDTLVLSSEKMVHPARKPQSSRITPLPAIVDN